jgi:glycosyltransferase involved in cell wall biosynthesis
MILSNPFIVDPRVYKEAMSLSDAGHEVTVVFWDRHADYPSNDMIKNVRTIGIRNTGITRVLPHDLFRNPFWWHKAYKKALELYKNGYAFDVVHCHDLDTLQTGVWLKKRLNVKLVYDAHEIFGYMIARNMPRVIVRFAFWMEKLLLKNVDHIITVVGPLQDYFKSISKKPLTIIMNCKELVSTEYIPPKTKEFTLLYIGVLHTSRMFPELVDIIGQIEKVMFIIAGKKENLFEEVKQRSTNYSNIQFLGTIPFVEVIPKTLASNVVICIISPRDPNNKIGLANKQFEAMVCGRPIICTRDTYAGQLVEKLSCGLLVDYTKESITEAIITLRDNPTLCEQLGKNAFTAAQSQYNWEKEKEKLITIYNTLIYGDKKT